MTKFIVHTMLWQNIIKLHEISFAGYLIMTQFVEFKQFKGYNSSLSSDKCKMHPSVISCMKFQKSVTYLWLILVILNQFKGDYSCISEASLTKLYMQHSIMIYTSCKFHEMLFIGYLVMALDQPENYINPSLKGDKKNWFKGEGHKQNFWM